jgi:hypothetical protein
MWMTWRSVGLLSTAAGGTGMTADVFSEQMREIANTCGPEDGHLEADRLMCKIKLGYQEGVEIFAKMG